MSIENKIKDPICIRFGGTDNVILADDENKPDIPLDPGAMICDNRYGFVLITDVDGKQKEMVYPTQCRVNAIGVAGDVLNVYEEGKKRPWIFNKFGKLEHSPFGEFTDFIDISKIDSNIPKDMPMEDSIFKNPISIKISKNSKKRIIIQDEIIPYPLYPGVLFETEHYGFILIIDTDEVQREVWYPTQNRIIGIEENMFNDIMIYENGKYHPWHFSDNGEFKEEASYNPYSRKDQEFVKETYGVDIEDVADDFALKMKK